MIITRSVRLRLGELSKAIPFRYRAFDFLLYAADGMPRAFTAIGYALDRDPKFKALNRKGQHVYWYRLGARLGDYMGAYNLGQCYELGAGVSRNMRLAVFWWKKAARAEYPTAFTNLAAAYYNGDGVARNVRKAMWLYGRASIGGDMIAQRMLNKLDWG